MTEAIVIGQTVSMMSLYKLLDVLICGGICECCERTGCNPYLHGLFKLQRGQKKMQQFTLNLHVHDQDGDKDQHYFQLLGPSK